MRLNSDLILRQVKDEYMIINPFSETVDMTQVYTLNETAAWLWQQMEGKEFEVKDLAEAMLEEYEVDEDDEQYALLAQVLRLNNCRKKYFA